MVATVPSLIERVLPFLRRYGARRAGLFGSYARGEADASSDLDLLVELPQGASLLDLIGLQQDLSDELGLQVEATTYRALHPQLRDRVLQDEIRIL
jgi:uncharacterized protein